MVLFFTGTGNSLYVAKRLDDSRYSIPQLIREEVKEYTAEQIGIVCPVYGHEMPELVRQFISQSTFHTEYFYVVLTYGKIHGGAAELADSYLQSCGIHADYINTILMLDNYLPAFDMKEQLAIDSQKNVENHIEAIKADIQAKKHWKQEASPDDRMWHQKYLAMRAANPIAVKQGIFKVLDVCIGCGICMHVCPTGSIQVINQHAQYQDTSRCQMCLACVQHCPENAIRLTIPEKNPHARYHNGNIRLSEIVEANNQNKY